MGIGVLTSSTVRDLICKVSHLCELHADGLDIISSVGVAVVDQVVKSRV